MSDAPAADEAAGAARDCDDMARDVREVADRVHVKVGEGLAR